MRAYSKSILFTVVAGIVFLQGVIGDGLSWSDLAMFVATLAGAAGVYLIPNLPQVPYAKGITAVVATAFTVIAGSLTDDYLTPTEILGAVIAAAGSIGVVAVPNVLPSAEVGLFLDGKSLTDADDVA